MRAGRGWVALALPLIVAACAGAPAVTYPPMPTFPIPPEVLGPAASGPPSATVTCGGPAFPISGLDAPAGAQDAVGPEFDALRAALQTFGSEFPGSDAWDWRLATRTETLVLFIARTDDLGAPGWVDVTVERDGVGWRAGGMGQCDPKVVLSAEFGPASWALDPEFPAPTVTSTELRILVWEGACSGGAPATGRISPPVVVYDSKSVTITLGVRPIQVPAGFAVTCPGPPGTPAILTLSEPLGARDLLDEGRVPPSAPSPF